MSSPAQLIRRTIVDGLKAEATRAGERVFGNRTRPVWKDDMPVLLVFTRDERTDPVLFQVSPKWYRRRLSVAVVTVDVEQGQPDDLVDDRLDELGEAVERYFFRDPRFGLVDTLVDVDGVTIGGFEIEDTRLQSVDLVTFQPDDRVPDRPLAGQRIVFEVVYLQPAPEGRTEDLERFLGLNLEYRLKPGDDLPEARDRVDLAGS